MQTFFGSFVLEFIGACVKWLLNFLVCKIEETEPISFEVIWKGRPDDRDMDSVLGGVSNILVGAVVLVTVLMIFVAI